MKLPRTVFAFRVANDDELSDLLALVAREGVGDDQWEWLAWKHPRGGVYVVVRSSLSVKGVFLSFSQAQHLSVTKAHARGAESRCAWISHDNAAEGREELDRWMDDLGFDVQSESFPVPTAAQARTVKPRPLEVRGRDRLAAASGGVGQVEVARPDSAPREAAKREGGQFESHAGAQRQGSPSGVRRPKVARAPLEVSEADRVLDVFRQAMDAEGSHLDLLDATP